MIGNWQASEALKICAGRREAVSTGLLSLDLWSGEIQRLNLSAARERGTCLCCKRRNFEFLEGGRASASITLCGRNAVQINPRQAGIVDVQQLAARLQNGPASAGPRQQVSGEVQRSRRGRRRALECTVFADGRAIIKGTGDVAKARTAYAKYVGL